MAARENNIGLTAEQTKDAMKNARTDRFKATQDLVGQVLKIENFETRTFQDGNKSFTMILRGQDGKKINFPFGYFRDGRVVSKSDAKGKKEYLNFKNVYLETEADALINNSELVWKVEGIEEGKDYKFPSAVKIKSIVIPQHQQSKQPLRGLRYYKGADVVAAAYQNAAKPYPQLPQLEAELRKTKAEGRIAGLNDSVMALEPVDGISDSDLHTYRMQFVFEDIQD